jgi:hypothetical protein
VGALLNPVRGIRDAQQRRGRVPRDHAKENLRALREKQQRNRQTRADAAARTEKKFVMERFRDVKSRWVKPDVARRDAQKEAYLQKRAEEIKQGQAQKEAARRQLATSRREAVERASAELESLANANANASPGSPPAPSRGSPPAPAARRRAAGGTTPRKAAVPRRGQGGKLAPRSNKNFIKGNMVAAIARSPPKAPNAEDENKPDLHSGFGEVPAYIRERQQAAAEAQRAAEEKAEREKGCPPGMTRMSEDERVETLAVLMKNKEVGYQELAKLPMTVETPSLRRRKADLERKLEQIDDAIKIFSRECVWVQEDA